MTDVPARGPLKRALTALMGNVSTLMARTAPEAAADEPAEEQSQAACPVQTAVEFGLRVAKHGNRSKPIIY